MVVNTKEKTKEVANSLTTETVTVEEDRDRAVTTITTTTTIIVSRGEEEERGLGGADSLDSVRRSQDSLNLCNTPDSLGDTQTEEIATEQTGTEDTTTEDTETVDTETVDTAIEDTVIKDTAAKDNATEDIVIKDTATMDTSIEDNLTGETSTEKNVTENTDAENILTGDTVPENVITKNSGTQDTLIEVILSETTLSEKTAAPEEILAEMTMVTSQQEELETVLERATDIQSQVLESIVGVVREEKEVEEYDKEVMDNGDTQKAGIVGLKEILETPADGTIKCEGKIFRENEDYKNEDDNGSTQSEGIVGLKEIMETPKEWVTEGTVEIIEEILDEDGDESKKKVEVIGEIIEEQGSSNVTDDNDNHRDEKLGAYVTMCPAKETDIKIFEKEYTKGTMQAVNICNKTTVETEVESELSLFKSEDKTVEVKVEVESFKAPVEPEMQEESDALAALDAVVCKNSSAVSELTQDETTKSCTLKESPNESSLAMSESSQDMTKSSTMIMDLTPAPVKLSDGQANVVNGHSHTLPRQKKRGKTTPTTLVSAPKKLTKSLVSAPKKPNVGPRKLSPTQTVIAGKVIELNSDKPQYLHLSMEQIQELAMKQKEGIPSPVDIKNDQAHYHEHEEHCAISRARSPVQKRSSKSRAPVQLSVSQTNRNKEGLQAPDIIREAVANGRSSSASGRSHASPNRTSRGATPDKVRRASKSRTREKTLDKEDMIGTKKEEEVVVES